MRQLQIALCIFLIAALSGLISCNSSTPSLPMDHIADSEVKRVLSKAIPAAGGWDNWQNLQRISYSKKSILYHADGTVESEVNQRHKYVLQPELQGSITWSDSSGNHEILYSSASAARLLNNELVEGSEEGARNTFLSAYYVLFVPFKIMDPGASLTYLGLDTLDQGSVVECIRAEYNPDEEENHSTNDTWYFYFDKETGDFLANMVYHAPTYALIENNEVNTDLPIKMNTYRESWRVDSLRNKEFLRGVFFYGDFLLD